MCVRMCVYECVFVILSINNKPIIVSIAEGSDGKGEWLPRWIQRVHYHLRLVHHHKTDNTSTKPKHKISISTNKHKHKKQVKKANSLHLSIFDSQIPDLLTSHAIKVPPELLSLGAFTVSLSATEMLAWWNVKCQTSTKPKSVAELTQKSQNKTF